ncbi:MAG: DNA alkylation repair protein [Rickettsiales bacterium]|nr:DNA alkylation repair protein [Rickettsiales bacterium]
MLLKEVYNDQFLNHLAKTIFSIDRNFNQKKFLENFPKKTWQEKSLKQRMRAITIALDENLSGKNFIQKIAVLKQVAPKISGSKNSANKNFALALIIFPDFVEVFGLQNFNQSMSALEFFTQFGSAEFAMRKFIKLDQNCAFEFLLKFSKSENYHVRRLASEACRPRLPWGEILSDLKKNPAPILSILENLKFDQSNYVRKSVANNLNDISKDHPLLILNLLARWKKEKVAPNLISHALRTLLKKGDKSALALIDINCNNLSKNFIIQNLALQKTIIRISQDLVFNFTLKNQAPNNKIRLEYAIYFLKKSGVYQRKNFQISTKNFSQGSFKFSKTHNFSDLSTRKHNVGKHFISLIANGVEIKKLQFDLI